MYVCFLVDEEQDGGLRGGDLLQRPGQRAPEGCHATGVSRPRVHAFQGQGYTAFSVCRLRL